MCSFYLHIHFTILHTEINKNYKNIEKLYRDLESDFEYCYSYVEKNMTKSCNDGDKILKLLLKIDWQ